MARSFPNRKPSDDNPFGTVAVLSQVIQGNGQQSLGVNDMRARIKMLDAIEVPGDKIIMADDLHMKLVEMINLFQFAVAHRGLLQVIDDVENAAIAPDPSFWGGDAQQTGG